MLDNKIVNQVVSALLNQNGGNNHPTKLYGTAVVNDGDKYVKLDGSDTLTAIVEGTEVIDGDRVLVSIENHQAVVVSNITSPASARTATSYMDFMDGGLVIGELLDDGNDFNVLVKADGIYFRNGFGDNAVILAKYTGTNIILGSYGEINIQASSDQTTVETFNSTSFKLAHRLHSIASVVGATCIDTSDNSIVSDVEITDSDYSLSTDSAGITTITVNSPLTGTTIVPQTIVVTYSFYGNPNGTISIGANSVISDKYPLVIGNNNPNKPAGNIFRVDWSGNVYGANGCNSKIVYVDKTITGLSVPANDNVNFSTSVSVPSGYIPCGMLAYRIGVHTKTCCFTRVDINSNGTIDYAIQNHSDASWSDVSAYFQVACIWTG